MARCSQDHKNPVGQQFCGECGASLRKSDAGRRSARVSVVAAERPAPSERMTLADKIAAERVRGTPTTVEPVATVEPVPAEPVPDPETEPEPEPKPTTASLSSRSPTFWLALGIALAPLLVSAFTVLTAGRDFHAYSDDALTELNIRDVGHHFVEVGVFNRFGWHHLGPLFFYALAPLYRLLGSRSFALLIGAVLINAATIVGIALVARRRAGDGFAVAALAGSMVVAHSYGASFLRSPWTPNIVVLATVLLVLLAWSLAEADMVMLPWAALVASWIVQTHLAPAPPVAATLVAGVAIGAWRIRSMSAQEPRAAIGGSLRRRALVAAGVLFVAWLPPLVDVVTHAGGNVQAVIDYFLNSPGGTLSVGYHVVSSQLDLLPPWLGSNPIQSDLFLHVVEPHGAIPWLGFALLGGIALAWRTRQSPALRFALIAAIAVVVEIVAVGRIEGSPFFWDVLYVPGTAMVATLATAYAVWRAVESRTSWPWLRPTVTALLVAALAVPATMLAVSSADFAHTRDVAGSDAIAAAAPGTLRSLRDTTGSVLVRATNGPVVAYHDLAGMVLLLDQHGVHAVVSPSLHVYFPSTSIQATNSFSATVTIVRLPDVFRYRPVRGERLAGVGGSTDTGLQRLAVHGGFAVFVAPGSSAGRLRPRPPRKRSVAPY
jgi:hypothetical protein